MAAIRQLATGMGGRGWDTGRHGPKRSNFVVCADIMMSHFIEKFEDKEQVFWDENDQIFVSGKVQLSENSKRRICE